MGTSENTQWILTALAGASLNGLAYAGVRVALRNASVDVPWEVAGAIVTSLGAIIAVAKETRCSSCLLGVNRWGLWSGAIIGIGVIITYAKGKHDGSEHDADVARLTAAVQGLAKVDDTLRATQDALESNRNLMSTKFDQLLAERARGVASVNDVEDEAVGAPPPGGASDAGVSAAPAGAVASSAPGARAGTPHTAAEFWRAGHRAYVAKNREEARAYYDDALRVNPKYAPALNSIGRIEGDEGKSDERSWYERALQANPRYAPALNNLAIVELAAGNVDQADQLAQQANAIQPGISATITDNIAIARQLKAYPKGAVVAAAAR